MYSSPRPQSSGTEPFPGMTTTTTTTITHPTTTTTTSLQVPGTPVVHTTTRSSGGRSTEPPGAYPRPALENRLPSRPPLQNRTSTIRIRRIPSNVAPTPEPPNYNYGRGSSSPSGGAQARNRSASEPPVVNLSPPPRANMASPGPPIPYMSPIAEGSSQSQIAQQARQSEPDQPGLETLQEGQPQQGGGGRLRSASNAARNSLKHMSSRISNPASTYRASEYESEVTDILDVVDPEVSTLTTLNNVQNSLFVPDLGWLVNRTPTYNLTPRSPPKPRQDQELTKVDTDKPLPPRPFPIAEAEAETDGIGEPYTADRRRRRSGSLTSVLSETHYAVLPHGVKLDDWTEEEKDELNDHVRHLLHSRKEKFKRSMKGFGQYIRKPLGFFVTLYAVLITLFGLAWVLFLIGWINVEGRQSYLINVIDNVLVALFAIMGDGLAPFRAVDTYHMIWIAHYHHLTWRLRTEKKMPKLQDKNDLPLRSSKEADLETAADAEDAAEFSVLDPKQQQRLTHHQNKFSKSHTFYKPHETTTHHAFPLRLLVAVVCLLDCHSLFQIALGTCTWAISYHVRPQALTATILCCSICCNISAGIVISVGDRKTRKKEVIEQMFRQALTQQAIRHVEKKHADHLVGGGSDQGEEFVDASTHIQGRPEQSKSNLGEQVKRGE